VAFPKNQVLNIAQQEVLLKSTISRIRVNLRCYLKIE
jgi:hypothetical protein